MGVFSRTCSGSASSEKRLWRSSAAGSGQGSGSPAALARLAYNTLPRPWKSTSDWSFPPTAALAPARGCGVAAAAPCLLLFLAEDRARLAPCKMKNYKKSCWEQTYGTPVHMIHQKLFAYYFHGTFTSFFLKIKSHKEVTKQQKSMFFLLFLIEGSGAGAGSGSISLTNGSG
jgi:hypothetical protein